MDTFQVVTLQHDGQEAFFEKIYNDRKEADKQAVKIIRELRKTQTVKKIELEREGTDHCSAQVDCSRTGAETTKDWNEQQKYAQYPEYVDVIQITSKEPYR